MSNKYYIYRKDTNGEVRYSSIMAVSYKDAQNWTRAKNLYLLNTSYFDIDVEQEVYKAIFDLAQKGERTFELDLQNSNILCGKDKRLFAKYNELTFQYTLV